MKNQSNQHLDLLPSIAYSEWKERLEVAGKAILAFVGIAYVAGLLILNSHVRSKGLDYMNFLQVQYVVVGVLWLFIIVVLYITASSVYFGVKSFWNADYSAPKNRGLLLVLKVTIATFLVGLTAISFDALVFQRLTKFKLQPFSNEWTLAYLALLAQGFILFAVIHLGKKFIVSLKSKDESDDRSKFAAWDDRYFFAANLLSFVFCISAYSVYLFPYLEPSYGGGKNQMVEFIVKETERDALNSLGFRFIPDSRNIGKQEVILEAPDFFLLLPPEGHGRNVKAIRLRKDAVDAVYYLTDEK